MSTTDERTTEELHRRLEVLVGDIATMTQTVGQQLLRISHLRKEAQTIVDTIQNRSIT